MDKLSELNLVSEDFIEYPNRAVQKIYKNNGIVPVFLGSNPSPEILKDGISNLQKDKIMFLMLK
jgi:hypothetical protein